MQLSSHGTVFQELQDTDWPGDPPQVIFFVLLHKVKAARFNNTEIFQIKKNDEKTCDHTVNLNPFCLRVRWS